MNKRIRKKRRCGEFREFCANFALKLNSGSDMEQFLNDFVNDAVLANGCGIGGGGDDDVFEGYIELGTSANKPAEKLEAITNWVKGKSEVEKVVFGEITDAWYGPFEEVSL